MYKEQRAPLIRGGLRFGWVDFDAALEMGAVLDTDAGGGNVAGHRAVGLDVHAIAVEVADDFAVNDHFAGMNFGIEHGGGADNELMAIERDRAFHLAVNLQVFRTGELTLDMQAGTQAS
jgi:hypothetical protein